MTSLDCTDISSPSQFASGRATHGAIRRGYRYLKRQQLDNGSWLPLWFGNQDRPDEDNPVYGTAKVLIAGGLEPGSEQAGIEYLVRSQNHDGGWGGGVSLAAKIQTLKTRDPEIAKIDPIVPEEPANAGRFGRIEDAAAAPCLVSSVEETALAVEALATIVLRTRDQQVTRGGKSPPLDAPLRSDPAIAGLKSGDVGKRRAGPNAAVPVADRLHLAPFPPPTRRQSVGTRHSGRLYYAGSTF